MLVKSISPKMLPTIGLLAVLLLAVLLVAGPATAQNCPSDLAANPCAFDLVLGVMSPGCSMAPFYRVHSPLADSNGDNWLEAAVEVDLTDECSRVCVVLDYTEVPTGFSFNLGDSSTNDGFGGNAGGPESESEVQILDQRLTLWSIGLGPSILDRVAEADLQLENGSYKVCVSDQRVTFGQPQSIASTPNSQLLFALPDMGTSPPNKQVYVGLNRVISALGGSPSGGRIGTGLRRAYITID